MLRPPDIMPGTIEPASLPQPRGPLTEALFAVLREPAGSPSIPLHRIPLVDDALYGEDTPLALYALYELHYRGFAGVADEWEWDAAALRLRQRLEDAFLAQLHEAVAAEHGSAPVAAHDVAERLRALAAGTGPSLSAFMATDGTLRHMREFAIHRSPYQLKEADPHTWAIPRLHGAAKAALITIQTDEYGSGSASHMHSELFADTMRALDLDARYGAYLDAVPGATLSTVNLVSLFGLHRRWRGALIGHLALFEMCSVVPMGRYVDTLRRFGLSDATPFYDAHVVADQWHQTLALHEMVGGLVDAEPQLSGDIVFGARALDHLERRLTRHLLDAWSRGVSTLREAAAGAARALPLHGHAA